MTIRGNRGRAAAFRKVWGWPLRSTRHLAASVAILLTLSVGAAVAQGQLGGDKEPGNAAAPTISSSSRTSSWTSTASTSTTTAPSTSASSATAPTPPPATDPVQLAGAVVRDFMTNWINTAGKSAEAWVNSLTAYTVPEYVAQLKTVDPSRIGAVSLTGPATSTSTTASVIEWEQPTSRGAIKVTTVLYQGTWRVKQYNLAGDR